MTLTRRLKRKSNYFKNTPKSIYLKPPTDIFKISIRYFICATILLLTSNSFADYRGSVAFQGGVAFPSSSSNVFTFGAMGQYRFSPWFGGGPFFFKYGIGLEASSDSGSASIDTSNFFYGLQADVFLKDTLKNFQTGLKIGLAHISTTINATSGSTNINIASKATKFFFAPKISYDQPIGGASGRFSVGVEISYAITLSSNAPNVFNILLTPKFWF